MATPTKKPAAKPAAAPTPSEPAPATADTAQAQIAALQAQLAAAQAEAALAKLSAPRGDSAANQYVGIRNISNYAIDLPRSPLATEPGVQLVPDTAVPDPRQVAVISYAWWLQLRTHHLVSRGMILRDDSVLGSNHAPAPADDPRDLPRDAAVNQVPDVGAFFAELSEAELAARIEAMTSEQTIRRLQFGIDQEVARIQASLPEDPANPGKRAEGALRALPGKLAKAEQLLQDRYLVLTAQYREA